MELIDIEYHPKGPKEEKSGDDGERNDSWAAWSANDGDEHAIYKVRLKRKSHWPKTFLLVCNPNVRRCQSKKSSLVAACAGCVDSTHPIGQMLASWRLLPSSMPRWLKGNARLAQEIRIDSNNLNGIVQKTSQNAGLSAR